MVENISEEQLPARMTLAGTSPAACLNHSRHIASCHSAPRVKNISATRGIASTALAHFCCTHTTHSQSSATSQHSCIPLGALVPLEKLSPPTAVLSRADHHHRCRHQCNRKHAARHCKTEAWDLEVSCNWSVCIDERRKGGTCTVEKEPSPVTASAWDTRRGAPPSPGESAPLPEASGCRKQPRTSPPHCRRPIPNPAKHSAPSAHQNNAPANSLAAAAACLRTRDGDRAASGDPLAPCVPALTRDTF